MREQGYYWIKCHDHGEPWTIGMWDGIGWRIPGSEVYLYDANPGDTWGVLKVGEQIPAPQRA